MELVLKQTQQGSSYEVSVNTEGVEELKRKVKIKGEKKEALLTLRQKLEHVEYNESNTYVLERFNTLAGNLVKEILLKLNLPDHRSILTDSKIHLKMGIELRDRNWKLRFEHSGGLLAGIHGLFSGRNCCLVRRITCGYPWPELEGKRFGLIQERLRSSAWCLNNGLKKLCNDQDVLQMLKYVDKYKVIDLYVDHSVTNEPLNVDESLLVNVLDNDVFIENQMLEDNDDDVIKDVSEDEWLQKSLRLLGKRKKDAVENDNVVEFKSDRDHGSGSDVGSGSGNGSSNDDDSDSQESDFLVDPDNMIDDVEMDMAEFKRNINANVEWVGSKQIVEVVKEGFEDEEVDHEDFDSGSDSEYKGEKKKALKMFNKMNKANAQSSGTAWKENFVIGQKFPNRKMIKEMITRVSVEHRK
ncbi:hypothetical protein Tco_0722070 [Tanacetum coccineum]